MLAKKSPSLFRRGGPPLAAAPKLELESKNDSKVGAQDQISLSQAAKAQPKQDRGIRGPALKALAAISAFSALAGPAMAQAPPGMAPLAQQTVEQVMEVGSTLTDSTDIDLSVDSLNVEVETLDLLKNEAPIRIGSDTTETKFGVRFDSVNDFMPDSWTDWLGSPEHKTPDGSAFDDDGWTAEVKLEANIQRGDRETVFGGRLAMITQTGSRAPFAADYQGLRTDLGELVVQQNFRFQPNERTTVDYGVGGGVQAIGNLGGERLQTWWHEVGPAGGRVGDDLQGNYTSQSFRAMPLVTGGAKVTYQAGANLDLITSTQASVPFGQGIGNVGFRAGIGSSKGAFRYEVGGKLDATWTNARELDFHEIDGIRDGLYAKVEYEPGKYGAFFTQLETGGLRNEPVLSVGFRIGGGTQSRLSPFW